MKKYLTFLTAAAMLLLIGCKSTKVSQPSTDYVANAIETATKQLGYQVKIIEDSGKFMNPRTIENGKVRYVGPRDWTSGFFPGTLFYMYDLTKDKKWLDCGVKYTETLEPIQFLTQHHDVGFMINCSYGNALRLTNNESYKDIIVQAAKSLSTRFRPVPGVIQSWDEDRGWQGTRGWECPVIIDNMMNLELLFEATKFSGDSSFYKIAVSHADNTMANHYRPDWSCYHVIDYAKNSDGHVRNRHNAQGYAHESAWARGQAWGLYGYTMCYRYTKDQRYLDMVHNIYNFIFKHKNLPADLVPYWDFNDPAIPNAPRDASAAAIMASGLYEAAEYGHPEYKETAEKIMESLCGPHFLALVGTNGNFALMHSTGSIPHGQEIDVPLNYADYYFLEALTRKLKK